MHKLIFLFIPLIIGCNGRNSADIKSVEDYQYPLDSLIVPKVFIYQNTDSLNLISYQYRGIIKIENDRLLVKYSIGDGNMRDSSVYIIPNGIPELKESFMLLKDSQSSSNGISKGEIIDDINSFTKKESMIKYLNPFSSSIISEVRTMSTYDSIMFYHFGGKDIECIKYNDKFELSVKHKYIPFIGRTIEKTGISIYAKGLGLVYYNMIDSKTKENSEWKLLEIIDYSDYQKK
jgi:hypothetical protein